MTINRLFSMTKASAILFALSLYNCNNANNESEAAINELPLSNEEELTFLDSATSADLLEQAYADTVIYDENYYPGYSPMPVSITTTGTFHSEEFAEADLDLKWWGIFQNEDSTYLTTTTLETARVHDEIVDEEGQETGWSIETINTDNPILLIEEMELFEAHKMDTIAIGKNQIFPEDTVHFNYKAIDYTLHAIGNFRNDPEAWPNFYNYKLFLSATIDGAHCESLIAAAPTFDDAMITLLFCGDIDNDGVLDFLFDTSSHYNGMEYTLFLSSARGAFEVVNPIGQHISVGC